MTQIIQVPDVGTVEFPDNMNDAQIADAIRRNFSQAIRNKTIPAFEREARDPASSMSGAQQLAAGAGKGMTDLARGAGQMLGVGPSREEMDVIKQQDRSLMQSGMGMAGNVLGGMAAAAPIMATPGVNTLLGSALSGASLGAGQPVGTQDSRAMNAAVGGALGVGIPLAARGLGKVGSAVTNALTNPVGRTANRAADADRAAIIQALRNTAPDVPGQPLTAGEAATGVGRPEFNALQELVRGKQPTQYDRLAQSQNAARASALRGVAQTTADLEAAIAQRGANAASNYGAAYQNPIKGDPALMKIWQNPFFRDAIDDATKLAQANGINPKTDLTQFLHFVKLSLDKQLTRTGDTALSRTEKAAVSDVKDALVTWMGNKNPAYEQARAAFARESEPINQMQVGQYLENKLLPAMSDQGMNASQRSATYAQALRDAPRTIENSTGQPFGRLSDVLTQAQEQSARSVGASLGRKAEHERLAREGTQKARSLLAPTEVPPTGMFSPIISTARAIANRLSGKLNDRGQEQLAAAMRDPQLLATLMEKAATPQAQMLADMLRRYSPAITAGAVAPMGDQ